MHLRTVAVESVRFVSKLPCSICKVIALFLCFHKTAFFIDNKVFTFNTPRENFLPIFLDQTIPQLNNLHSILSINTDPETIVQVKRWTVKVVILSVSIKYQWKTHIGSFQFILSDQRVLCGLEVPMLVKHPKNCTTRYFCHVLVIVLSKSFFVDQTQLIHLVQLLIILFGRIFICKNFCFAIINDNAAIIWMTDQMLRSIKQTPVSPVIVQDFKTDRWTSLDIWIFLFVFRN
ncbi:hypothetical protein D3C76_1174570 [compost metagenome]